MRLQRLFLFPALVATLALGACDVEQTEEGELPEVDVEATEGNLPEYDVEGPDIDITQDTSVITTPDIDIDPPS